MFMVIYFLFVLSSSMALNISNDSIDYWKNIFATNNRFKRGSNVNFTLYTSTITEKPLTISNIEDIDIQLPIKFIIHGWGESRLRPYYSSMTEAYLAKGNSNIVQVDWSKPAAVDYVTAVKNTERVGRNIANFILKLIRSKATNHDLVHLIGHSLGAHVAGVVGKEVFKGSQRKIGRITGLDPAGPLYEEISINRLLKTDAHMVDVIHTDGGLFGYMGSLGTVDFYPNGGVGLQPGCSLLALGYGETFKSATEFAFCSHMKSHFYFIQSINTTEIIAVKCNSWYDFEIGTCPLTDTTIFGENVPMTATGNYYFRTTPLGKHP